MESFAFFLPPDTDKLPLPAAAGAATTAQASAADAQPPPASSVLLPSKGAKLRLVVLPPAAVFTAMLNVLAAMLRLGDVTVRVAVKLLLSVLM